MKLFLVCASIFISSALFSQNYSRVKINTGSEGLRFLAEQGVAVDHGTYKKDTHFITDLSEDEIEILKANGFTYEILIADVIKFYQDQNKNPATSAKNELCNSSSGGSSLPAVPVNFSVPSTYGGYFKYAEMLSELDQMAAAYPSLITVKAPISTFLTAEGRPIYHVKISDNPNVEEAEPEVLYTAIHHAREPMGMSETIFYMWYLLENYASNPEIAFLLNNTELYFVPCVNPDGYVYNEVNTPAGGGMHRKNRNPAVGTSNKGVDINRNYSYGWNTTGVSPNVNNDTYPGTGPFSEPETQAMKWLNENHTFVSAFNAHTYSNLLLFPIGTTVAEFADHHDYFNDLGQHMCKNSVFTAQKSSTLYPASGDSDDYMYKVDIGVGLKDTVFAFTPEIGESFWPPMVDILPTCQEMFFPNLVLAHMAHKYLVVKEDDPTLIATTSGTFHHNVQRLGLENGAVTVSLVPLLNVQSVGAPVTYNLAIREMDDSNISYTLSPSIQLGDEVKYIIETNYGTWIDRDTIYKIYGSYVQQAFDDASTNTNWTGSWALTSSDFYSATNSFTDSPSGNYNNNANTSYQFNNSIDLTNATGAQISFFAKWEIEAEYDYCQFQVSTDNGTTWNGQCGLYTNAGTSADGSVQPDGEPIWDGAQASWVREEIDLSDYLGQIIKVRFVLKADPGTRGDGFYFDDFTVAYNTATSGIEGVMKPSIVLFPNPSKGAFELVGLDLNADVIILDLDGKIVKEFKSNSENMKIELKNQAAGTYFVKTTKNGEAVELKFVIQK